MPRRLAIALLVALCMFFGLVRPAYAAVVPTGTYTDWAMPANAADYNRDSFTFVGGDPGTSNSAWFFAHQFNFSGSSGGYNGIQAEPSGKAAIFTLWGATAVNCSSVAGAVCVLDDDGAEGTVGHTRIPYNWQAGVSYRQRLWLASENSSSRKWCSWIAPEGDSSMTLIGCVTVPTSQGRLSWWSGNWTEWYGNWRTNCSDFPQATVYFRQPQSYGTDTTASLLDYHVASGAGCNANITVYGGGWMWHRTPI